MKGPEAFIFDLDGVITKSSELHYLAWEKISVKYGIPFNRKINEKLKGVERLNSIKIILEEAGMETEFSENQLVNIANEKNEIYKRYIERVTPCDVLPGISTLFQTLVDQNIKIALASSSKNAPLLLEKLRITHYFDYIADANFIKRGKPHPEIFLNAAQGLNADPFSCIGIEDSVAGIKSIKAANMFAVGIGDCKSLIDADITFKTTEEITFDKINSNFNKAIMI
ncbi:MULTISPECIES: beta-phosphoglucomutase [Cytobacillus]|uniref:Beta-phosphoglucomutase n=1 Tax=Cytobacillus firmus DS1 TaxID=1307436 RepID=W7KZU0_CYTFI|nr:beta-phosphoglucomutase [Cytobacillus firmus]EWG08337.1 beta-phosphoglucomutase [Cytobacillus firmus DS1]MBG9550274.1 hypothetical protein [Cytobacillus firmus]MBG9605435.1 hypothetical protein [Cytobacillus firmus]MED1942970.1 beta-phosphoglucomutase [Cytobacillus firmus]